MERKNVAVLMATYNSAKYMRCQIDSILAQEGVNVTLMVRDDGSTKDNTIDILNEYAQKGSLSWYTGENLKSARCFLQLLKDAPDADFYAFADHDDYWMPDKLSVAVNSIASYSDTPALYLCQPQDADSELHPLPYKIYSPIGGFAESLIYMFAMGCTMVLNNPLRNIVNSYTPSFLHMHDVWIYTLAYSVGANVVWDPVPHTLNRQHGDNVVGLGQGHTYMLRLRLKRFFAGEEIRYRQAVEIQKGYYNIMPKENRLILSRFIEAKKSFFSRISLIFSNTFRCSDRTTQYLLWVNLLFNKY